MVFRAADEYAKALPAICDAIALPTTNARMTAITKARFWWMTLMNVSERARNYEENWDEERISEEFELLFGRFIVNRRIDCEPGKKRANNSGQVDALGNHTRLTT